MSLDCYKKGLDQLALKNIEKAYKLDKKTIFLMQKFILLAEQGRADEIDYNILKENFKSYKKNSFHCYVIGYCYFRGLGIEKDYEEAIKWLTKSAEKNNDLAMYFLAFVYERKNMNQKAFYWYRKTIKHGNLLGIMGIAKMHMDRRSGLGRREAFQWYKEAAELGQTDAMNAVAVAYYYGMKVNRDSKKAFEWYIKSAKLGNQKALIQIARMYYRGHGTEKNYKKAFKYYEKASHFSIYDMAELGDMYYRGHGTEKNYKKAFECYRKSANAGNFPKWKTLANMCRNGEGTQKDEKKASFFDQKYKEKFIEYKRE